MKNGIARSLEILIQVGGDKYALNVLDEILDYVTTLEELEVKLSDEVEAAISEADYWEEEKKK